MQYWPRYRLVKTARSRSEIFQCQLISSNYSPNLGQDVIVIQMYSDCSAIRAVLWASVAYSGCVNYHVLLSIQFALCMFCLWTLLSQKYNKELLEFYCSYKCWNWWTLISSSTFSLQLNFYIRQVKLDMGWLGSLSSSGLH